MSRTNSLCLKSFSILLNYIYVCALCSKTEYKLNLVKTSRVIYLIQCIVFLNVKLYITFIIVLRLLVVFEAIAFFIEQFIQKVGLDAQRPFCMISTLS